MAFRHKHPKGSIGRQIDNLTDAIYLLERKHAGTMPARVDIDGEIRVCKSLLHQLALRRLSPDQRKEKEALRKRFLAVRDKLRPPAADPWAILDLDFP